MDQIVSIPLPDPTDGRDSPKGPSGSGRRRLLPLIVGPENPLVEVLVHAVLADDTAKYNPVVVAGSSGLGKSHLAHGLAAAYQAQHPRRAVICEPAVDFARAWADAIESQATDRFRKHYGAARLLIVEDLNRLADYESAQQVLVSLLDAAVAANRQVIVTATSPPGRWVRISPVLQSRLEAGLCVQLAAPARDTREAILRDAARRRGVELTTAAARVLAAGPAGSARDLLGVLAELHVSAQMEGRAIDEQTAREFVTRRHAGTALGLEQIAAAVARACGVPLGQLLGRSQRQQAVAARAVGMYLGRQWTDLSLEQIGHYFGGRDHTTVLHHCRKTQKLCRSEPAVQRTIDEVEAILRSRTAVGQPRAMAAAQ